MTELTLHDLSAARTSNHWAEYVADDFRWLWATVDQCKDDPWRLAEIKRQLQHSVNKYTEPRLAKQLRFREIQLEIYLALLWAKPLSLRPTNAAVEVRSTAIPSTSSPVILIMRSMTIAETPPKSHAKSEPR